MGCSASSPAFDGIIEEKDHNKKIETTIKSDQLWDRRLKKLLLLGAGSSGKSTLFKQSSIIYGKGFTDLERKAYKFVVYHNVINAIQSLIINHKRYLPASQISDSLLPSVKFLLQEFRDDQPINDEFVPHIKALWADKGIRVTYEYGFEFHLIDQAKYFLDKVEEIASPAYVPSDDDILRVRAPTTAIVEMNFEIDSVPFSIIDVGGQRNERRKWIHCFENVTAVLFVAALSEYNQRLYEDESTNRLVEAITLFDQICNSKWFRRTHLILFLNKRDLFAEKLPRYPLSQSFPEYAGINDYNRCIDWIEHQFISKNREEKRQIYTHITCATDQTNIRAVFVAVRDILVRKNL